MAISAKKRCGRPVLTSFKSLALLLCADLKQYVLSVCLSIGDVLVMSNYDDVCPKVIHTGLSGKQ